MFEYPKAAAAEAARQAALVVPGAEVEGVVDGVREFGAFIKLPGGKSGLLHISRMGLPEGPARQRQLMSQFAVGNRLNVKILAFEGDRISLGLPGVEAKVSETAQEQAAFAEFRKSQSAPQGELGNLGGLFGGLDKLKLP
jgi:predicted RNA-binding protein with RPS1 domain